MLNLISCIAERPVRIFRARNLETGQPAAAFEVTATRQIQLARILEHPNIHTLDADYRKLVEEYFMSLSRIRGK